MREALVIQDTSALGQLWSDEYTFTATTGTMLTREQRLAAVMQPGFSPDDQPDALPPHEADVQLLGTVAVVRARTSSARLLTVWVRRKGRWQVVASQASSVAARPSTR